MHIPNIDRVIITYTRKRLLIRIDNNVNNRRGMPSDCAK